MGGGGGGSADAGGSEACFDDICSNAAVLPACFRRSCCARSARRRRRTPNVSLKGEGGEAAGGDEVDSNVRRRRRAKRSKRVVPTISLRISMNCPSCIGRPERRFEGSRASRSSHGAIVHGAAWAHAFKRRSLHSFRHLTTSSKRPREPSNDLLQAGWHALRRCDLWRKGVPARPRMAVRRLRCRPARPRSRRARILG